MAESKSKAKRSSSGSKSKRSSAKSGSKSQSRSSSARSGSKSQSGSSSKRSPSRRNSSNDRTPREVVMEGVTQLQQLIGRPVEAVTGMERNGREWTLTVEVVELERIPNTTDVLGKYEVTVDRDGELLGAKRTRRYSRGDAGED